MAKNIETYNQFKEKVNEMASKLDGRDRLPIVDGVIIDNGEKLGALFHKPGFEFAYGRQGAYCSYIERYNTIKASRYEVLLNNDKNQFEIYDPKTKTIVDVIIIDDSLNAEFETVLRRGATVGQVGKKGNTLNHKFSVDFELLKVSNMQFQILNANKMYSDKENEVRKIIDNVTDIDAWIKNNPEDWEERLIVYGDNQGAIKHTTDKETGRYIVKDVYDENLWDEIQVMAEHPDRKLFTDIMTCKFKANAETTKANDMGDSNGTDTSGENDNLRYNMAYKKDANGNDKVHYSGTRYYGIFTVADGVDPVAVELNLVDFYRLLKYAGDSKLGYQNFDPQNPQASLKAIHAKKNEYSIHAYKSDILQMVENLHKREDFSYKMYLTNHIITMSFQYRIGGGEYESMVFVNKDVRIDINKSSSGFVFPEDVFFRIVNQSIADNERARGNNRLK